MTPDALDKLAAEMLMGMKFCSCIAGIDYYSGEGVTYDVDMWQPTRNIAQAFECLEKFASYAVVSYYKHGFGNVNFVKVHAAKAFLVLGEDVEYIEAATAPLAIVKACLKAKGVDIGND